jgi:carbon storage regulator
MLVLSRKVGERLQIDDDIIVTVVKLDDGRVRLGIEAPPHVRVLRQELCPPGHSVERHCAFAGQE